MEDYESLYQHFSNNKNNASLNNLINVKQNMASE